MSQVLIHDYRINIKGVKRKIIYQFSDVHLNLADELCTDEEKQGVEKRIEFWINKREYFTSTYNEPYDDCQRISATEHFENLLDKAREDGDALVLTGDIFDDLTEAHLRAFEKGFGDLGIPHIFACGNHERSSRIPDDSALALVKSPVQLMDLGDLVIMAFNDSERLITREQIDALKNQLSEGRPIIVAMHIPILTDNNEILKSCSKYFHLNYTDCPPENLEFIELISSNTDKIAAVFAGHLHFLNVCEIAPGLVQYVSTQGITGNINRYIIGE